MKRYFKPVHQVCLLSFLFLLACSDKYLELKPIGAVDESILATKSGVDGVLIVAYSLLDGAGAVGGVLGHRGR